MSRRRTSSAAVLRPLDRRKLRRRVSLLRSKDVGDILRLNKMLMVQDAEDESDDIRALSYTVLSGNLKASPGPTTKASLMSNSIAEGIESIELQHEKNEMEGNLGAKLETPEDAEENVVKKKKQTFRFGLDDIQDYDQESADAADDDDVDDDSDGDVSDAPSETEILDDVMEALNLHGRDHRRVGEASHEGADGGGDLTPVNHRRGFEEFSLVFSSLLPGAAVRPDKPWSNRSAAASRDWSFNCDPLCTLQRVSQLDSQRQMMAHNWICKTVLLPYIPQCQPKRIGSQAS